MCPLMTLNNLEGHFCYYDTYFIKNDTADPQCKGTSLIRNSYVYWQRFYHIPVICEAVWSKLTDSLAKRCASCVKKILDFWPIICCILVTMQHIWRTVNINTAQLCYWLID